MNRREFLQRTVAVGGGMVAAPAIITSQTRRPSIASGVQSGDVAGNRAIVWSRTDRPARMIVDYSTTESFSRSRRAAGPVASPQGDYTARLDLTGLPRGQRIFYRVAFHAIDDPRGVSETITGSFQTAPRDRRSVRLAWGGDVCGQGWGINPDFGGMKIYEAMGRAQPDFFIHSGDTIYADGVIEAEVKLDDGSIWRNLTTPEKSKVAETLDEFRGNHRYNLMDANVRRFNADVPMLAQWDDHEVRNNWYPGQILDDAKYTEKRIDVLAAHARRAFLDYVPIRFDRADPNRIYRSFEYGPLVDVLMLDERSYRGPNSLNDQTRTGPETAFIGGTQIEWMKERLRRSKATWKVIASDMPLGMPILDGKIFEAVGNSNGPPLGRELELAGLLTFIKHERIKNVVWLTADIHYAAAHYYDPSAARFTDFDPFWEFVAGPLHAGTFGPGKMDDTFGPTVKFTGIPPGMKPNRPPKDGLQFFGLVAIDGRTEAMTVSLHDIDGTRLFGVDLAPQ